MLRNDHLYNAVNALLEPRETYRWSVFYTCNSALGNTIDYLLQCYNTHALPTLHNMSDV